MSARPLFNLFRLPAFALSEMAVIRLLIALVVWRLWPQSVDFVGQPSPAGLALLVEHWFDWHLAWLSHPTAGTLSSALLAALLVVYVSGAAPILSCFAITLLLSLMGALENSQGFTTHHGQVVTLVMLAQFLGHGWQRLSTWKRPDLMAMTPADRRLREHRAGLFAAQQAVVATYVISAITKYKASGFGWIADAQYFPLQILKARQADFYSTLDPETAVAGHDRVTLWMEQAMTSSTLATQILVGSALILEFGAVLALLGRWWGVGISLLLISFHLTVSKVMGLNFRYNIWLLAILFLLPPALHYLRLRAVEPLLASSTAPLIQLWRRIPAKIMLLGIAASYLTISGPGWRDIGHGFHPDRVRQAEVYPLSSFPMYSGFSDAPNLVYITDGDGHPVAIMHEFNVVSSALKKIYDTELRIIRDQLNKSMRAMTAEERSPAGTETLRRLRDHLAPEAFTDNAFPTLHLHEIRITRGPEGFDHDDLMVGTLHTPPDYQPPSATDPPGDDPAIGDE